MNKLPTPRTDAAEQIRAGSFVGSQSRIVTSKFARTLERELQQANDYADRLVEHKDMVCLPADLKNLREANAHFATENEMLKNAMANDRDAARAEGLELEEKLKTITEQRDRHAEALNMIYSACQGEGWTINELQACCSSHCKEALQSLNPK
tara:strand:- start:18 stop:473 length:456 start_codon:yes stop_codon:yes gene_type:complete